MESQVLARNADMLRFAQDLGFEARHVPEDPGIVRIFKPLRA